MQLTGLHHLTAITARVRENHDFYTKVLGMRLVKRSVNQDDVSAYHLFYADAAGSPGTDLTFFDWAMAPERRGTRSVTCTCLRLNGAEAVHWWSERLDEHRVPREPVGERDGRVTLPFQDPEGQRLAFVDDQGMGDPPMAWSESGVPAEYQVRGLGPVVMSVPDLAPTQALVTEVMGMRPVREYSYSGSFEPNVQVFEMGGGGAHAELHVAVQPELRPARQGAGGVHHVAFRTPDAAEHRAWSKRLEALGVPNSGEVDRYYFKSLYFREPNGVLFEIATDGPGFSVDEDPDALGESVALPPFLEPQRERILAGLQPIE